MNKWLVTTALALAPVPALAFQGAAEPPAPAVAAMADADPALWVVRDEDTTIYLFGTFHLLDGRPWFNDEVKAAFDSSDELVLEAIIPANPAEMQPMVLRYAVDPNGRKLSERLTPEQNAALGEALSAIGVPAAAFDPLEPWFVSMTIASLAAQRLGISTEHGPEALLSRAARERGIPVGELEGIEWQLRLFDGMPEEQQIAQLRKTIENIDGLDEALAPMLAAWSGGDVDGLVELMNQNQAEDAAFHDLLFTNRNRTWAQWVDDRLDRPGTVFLAVGAGHLAGGNSVQSVLATRGIGAQRVAAQAAADPAS